MFEALESINERPMPFEYDTIEDLWNDEHSSKQMLKYHLNPEVDLSSRKASFIDQSVEWIVSRFKVRTGTQIADFGCGPGLYTSRLAEKKADVTGIDISKRSIRFAQEAAKKAGLDIRYVNQNYLTYETDSRFDLIIMIFHDFCALNQEQRKIMLFKFTSMLKPGGSVLLDVLSVTAFAKRKEKSIYKADLLDGFWAANKYYGFLNTIKYDEEKVVLDKYTIVEPDGMRTVYNWLQYFSEDSLKREFLKNGFETEALYSDVAGRTFNSVSDEIAIVAKKS